MVTTAKIVLLFLLAGLIPRVGPAQTSSFTGIETSASKSFDVATIKLNVSGDPGWRLGAPQHGTETIVNLELKKIIASSFRIQDSMVEGPAWLDNTHYDIVAKGPDPSGSNPEVWEMMRVLLADRFQLRYHLETKDKPIFALTVARSGAKLQKPEDGRCGEAIKSGKPCSSINFLPFGVGIVNMPVGALTAALGRFLQDRPVVDKTGLTEKYDVAVTWMPTGMKPEDLEQIPKELRPDDVSLFDAFERQAGLKLEAQKGPVQILVVDRIERPSEN
jgi:uncharacterized protein (TIGR03435 family)